MFYIQQDNKILLFDENKQRLQNTIAVIPQYQGLEIQEVEEGYVIYDFKLMTIEEMEEKQAQKERERLNLLSMTKREMFLGLYQAKQITPDMLKAQITDPQALIEFEYANDYYRGNPLINVIGAQLGFTTEQLDKFFQTKDYKYLMTCTLTINATPIEAIVTGAGAYPYGTAVDVNIECEGYISYTETLTLTEDITLNIELGKNTDSTEQASDASLNGSVGLDEGLDENTTDTAQSDIQDELDTTTSKSDETDTDILE